MYACLAVTCHLHFWQNDRDFLRATVVTRGWNGYQNKSQHRKLTLEKKILPPFQQGFEPATFQSQVRCSNHWAIPAPFMNKSSNVLYIEIPCVCPVFLTAFSKPMHNGQSKLSNNTPYVGGFAWGDMVHGCMVYTECTKTAAVSCGTSHASAVATSLQWIFKNTLWKASNSCTENHMRVQWVCLRAENSVI